MFQIILGLSQCFRNFAMISRIGGNIVGGYQMTVCLDGCLYIIANVKTVIELHQLRIRICE